MAMKKHASLSTGHRKGVEGETCTEAVRSLFTEGAVFPASEIFARVKECGSRKDSTIWQHLMSLVVNLPPARHHWKNTKPFLFLRPTADTNSMTTGNIRPLSNDQETNYGKS